MKRLGRSAIILAGIAGLIIPLLLARIGEAVFGYLVEAFFSGLYLIKAWDEARSGQACFYQCGLPLEGFRVVCNKKEGWRAHLACYAKAEGLKVPRAYQENGGRV